jgi:hypothetical protein
MDIVKAFNAASKDPDLNIRDAGRRKIRDETKDKYLSEFRNEKDREFVQKVLEETIYVSEDEMLKELHKSFDRFSEEIGNEPFYICLPKYKFSSEHIFTIHLWSRIVKKNFIRFVNVESDIKHGTNILIIDDCVYSGNNTLATIDEMTYNNQNKHINFHLVVPYVSVWGNDAITSFKSPNALFSINMYNTKEIINFFARRENEKYEKMERRFKLELLSQVPIYFDHKVANNFSTFEPIYLHGIIPDQKSFGILINYLPDTDVKERIYRKHFRGLDLFTKE